MWCVNEVRLPYILGMLPLSWLVVHWQGTVSVLQPCLCVRPVHGQWTVQCYVLQPNDVPHVVLRQWVPHPHCGYSLLLCPPMPDHAQTVVCLWAQPGLATHGVQQNDKLNFKKMTNCQVHWFISRLLDRCSRWLAIINPYQRTLCLAQPRHGDSSTSTAHQHVSITAYKSVVTQLT